MNLNYFTELTTTVSQVVVIVVYAIIVAGLLWAIRKDPRVSSAFVWYLLVRHTVTFAALLICSFSLFASISFFFIIVTCIDVRNFYEDPLKKNEYELPILKTKVSRKPIFQLFLFFLLDIVAWWIIMILGGIFPSATLWHRLSF